MSASTSTASTPCLVRIGTPTFGSCVPWTHGFLVTADTRGGAAALEGICDGCGSGGGKFHACAACRDSVLGAASAGPSHRRRASDKM